MLSKIKNKINRKVTGVIEKSQIRLSHNDFTALDLSKPVKKYAFVFVCQAGRLEIGSLLLAASLKRFLKCDYELIAAVPNPPEIMGKPDGETLNLLQDMGVRIEYINNEIVSMNCRSKRHLITNKMYCLRIPTSADKLIFLDGDILCIRDFYGDSRFSIPFSARLVALGGTLGFEGKWFKFYEALNVRMPNIRLRVEYPEGINYVPPCFNSGFVAVNSDLAHRLADCWFECWETIDKKGLVKHKPYHIGQVALAVAVSKMNIPYEFIERDWLYQYFYIYHSISGLKDNSEMTNLAKSLIKEYPSILKLIQDSPDWQLLLN